MAVTDNLRRLFNEKKSTRKPAEGRGKARLCVEQLEERAVPTTFTVTSLADATNTYTSGTLRWAIQQANTDTDPNGATINFNIAGGGTIQLAQELPILDNTHGITINGSNSADGGANDITISGSKGTALGSSTLSAAITSTTATSFTVASGTALGTLTAYTSIVQVDSEQMLVTSVSGSTISVIRGYDGTTAATHTTGATVTSSTPDRILFVGVTADTPITSVNVTPSTTAFEVENITLANGMAQGGYGQGGGGGGGGLGGAIFLNAGTLTLNNVTFTNDTAEGGGNNWDGTNQSGSAGGGGGMGGKGGSGGTSAARYGGGGGGFGTVGSTGTAPNGSREGSQGPGEFTDGTNAGGNGGLGVGKALAPAQADGGGGSAGASSAASNAGGGGGVSAGNGATSTGGAGGFGGGGGGGSGSSTSTISGTGGAGGYGGGGGGGTSGGAGGFGGGDGAGSSATTNFGGGTGGSASNANGGGGAGLGGAVFVRQGAILDLSGGAFSGGSAVGGAVTGAGSAGQGIGSALFLAGSAQWTVSSGTTTLSSTIGGGTNSLITGGFTKSGTGTLALTSTTGNSYTGNTTVTAGSLTVSNTSGSATGPGTVLVQNTATLADAATAALSGAVNINGGGGIAAVSGATLTLSGGLTFDADLGTTSPTATFTLNGTPNGTSSPLITVTSSGGLIANPAGTTNVVIAGSPQVGTYDLIGYTGSFTTYGNFNTTVSGPAGYTYTLSNNTASSQIDLTVAYALPTVASSTAALTSYSSGTTAAQLDSGLIATGLHLTQATVSITSGFDSSAPDQISWTNPDPNNMAGGYNASTGVFTITSANGDTAANYQAALESVTFATSSTSTATRTIQVVLTNPAGSSSVSYNVAVQVVAQLSYITVTPATASLAASATQTFSAVGYAANGQALANQPTFTWSADAAVGTINASTGVLTATQASGSGNVYATAGSIRGSSSVVVTDHAPTVATQPAADGVTADTITGTTAALTVLGADPDTGESSLTYTWAETSEPSGGSVSFGATNGTNAGKDLTATFTEAGLYTLDVTITDPGNLSVTSSSVTVDAVSTVTAISVSPTATSLYVGDTLPFYATALDQFGNNQPVTWSATYGAITSSGVYTAPTMAINDTVTASIGSLTGTSSVTITNPFDVTSTSDSGAGSLRAAISAAQTDTHSSGTRVITFDSSLFYYGYGSATIQLSTFTNDSTSLGASAFVISKAITLQGPPADGQTSDDQLFLEGQGSTSTFRFATVTPTGDLTLENLTLTDFDEQAGNGSTTSNYTGGGGGLGAGGALFNDDGQLVLSGVTISSCLTQGGAGSTGTSSHSTGVNFGGAGGGMGSSANGTLPGGPAGGPYNIGSGGVYNGTAPFGGGGVGGSYNEGFAGFAGGFGGGGGGGAGLAGGAGGFGGGAGDTTGKGGGGGGLGGAIFNLGGNVTVTNSTFFEDQALGGAAGGGSAVAGTGLGGAIFNLDGSLALTCDTITLGTTSGSGTGGSGIYNLSDGETAVTEATAGHSTATVTMTDTIVGETNATEADFVSTVLNSGAGAMLAGTSNIVSNNTVGSSYTDGGTATSFTGSALTGDPSLGFLTSNGGPTFTALPNTLPNSPAIAAGVAVPGVTTDQAGNSRSAPGALPTIGAVEVPDLVITPPQNQTVPVGQTATFTAASLYGTVFDSVQWAVSTDGGQTFSDLSGAISTTLTLPNVVLGMSGYEYEAVFTNAAGSITSTPATLSVASAATITLTDNSPNPALVGLPVSLTGTVTANGNAITGGTVSIETTNGTLVGQPVPVSNGAFSFSTTALTVGTWNLFAVFSGTSTYATSTSPTVTQMVVSTFQIDSAVATPNGIVLTFDAPVSEASLRLYTLPGTTTTPTDVSVLSPTGTAVKGSLVLDPIAANVATFVQTIGLFTTGTYSVTLTSAVKDTHGDALTNGTSYPVSSTAPSGPVVTVPSFARGAGQPVNLPANSTAGIPISLSGLASGVALTSASFTLTYDPTLLTVTAATLSSAARAAGLALSTTPTLIDAHHEQLVLSITTTGSGGTPFTSGTLLSLTATVPTTAPYLDKALLNLSGVTVNGGSASGQSAVDEAAYLGDVVGSKALSGADAAYINLVIASSASNAGFNAYKDLDPVIIGGIASGEASVSSTDALRIEQKLVGTSVPTIPSIPTGITVPTGADPHLFLGSASVVAGQVVTVPEELVDTANVTEPILGLDSVLFFDPSRFTVVGVTDGALLAGYGLAVNVDNTLGTIQVTQSATSPLTLEPGQGGVALDIELLANASDVGGTSVLKLGAGCTNNGVTEATAVVGPDGSYTLTPAPRGTDSSAVLNASVFVSGVDALIQITAPAPSDTLGQVAPVGVASSAAGVESNNVLLARVVAGVPTATSGTLPVNGPVTGVADPVTQALVPASTAPAVDAFWRAFEVSGTADHDLGVDAFLFVQKESAAL